jgi:DNA replication protein DnaC
MAARPARLSTAAGGHLASRCQRLPRRYQAGSGTSPLAALVSELVEATDDKTRSRAIARYARPDLLCLDELGFRAG